MASKSKEIKQLVDAAPRVLRPRGRPRGKPFAKGHKYGFPKGVSPNPGGKPKVFQKFAAKVAEEMMQPCPKEIKLALGLPKQASVYDAMVKSLLLQAAGGDTQAFTTARETVEGRLVQKNVNISASLEALQNDPNFVAWLEEHHGQYLMEANNGRNPFEAPARGLPESTDTEGIQGDTEDLR